MPKSRSKVNQFKQESAHRQTNGHTWTLPNVLSPLLRGQSKYYILTLLYHFSVLPQDFNMQSQELWHVLYAYLAAVGRRGWRKFYATLCDMVLYFHKDEWSFKQNASFGTPANAVRVHHAMATRATDYIKKQHVFRLQTADWSQFLFQARLATSLSYSASTPGK